MSVNTELSALLTKMGGTPLESDSNSDLIKKISNAYEGGGGSSGGILVVHEIDTGEVDGEGNPIMQLDKTWKEIHDAVFPVLIGEFNFSKDWMPLPNVIHDPIGGKYHVMAGLEENYSTDSENGYPRIAHGGK